MRRRQFLGTAGTVAGGLAGCLGSGSDGGSTPTPAGGFEPVTGGPGNDDQLPGDDDPRDGLPPAFETDPPARTVDPDRFRTISVDPGTFQGAGQNGVVVPLVPIDVAYYWYWNRSARFADARGPGGFENSHIYGAVSSPAPAGGEGDDPVDDWPTDTAIVCYCGCPHHLSGLRAASLLESGYERVYAIDEGFWTWHDRGYPMAGADVSARPALRVIEGATDPAHAGATAWARHAPTDQVEAATIGTEGRYRLELRFADVTPDAVVTVETPDYAVTATIRALTADVVTG